MPDDLTGSPQAAMYTAESTAGQIVRLETKRRLIKQRYDQLKAKHDAMEKELAEYKARPVDPTVEQLRAELLEIKHRKVFDRLAGDAGVNPGAMDNLWRTSGYKIDGHSDVINEDAIKSLIAEQKKTQPYLFQGGDGKPAATETKVEAKMEPGPGNSRGGLVRDSGKFQVRRRGPGSVRDPQWMQVNQRAYAEAEKNGNVEWID
jgi:hypothetical protein